MADEPVENTEESAEAAAEQPVEAPAEEAAATAVAEPEEAQAEEAAAAGGEAATAQETVAALKPARMITPDVGFVREVMAGGGQDLKKCFQCATCSVVCNLTPDATPFPRKEMQWAQWGLKDKLMGDPDVWLCHQCSDCVAQCPRDAKPGRVMQAIAKMTISSFSKPSFLGKAVGSPSSIIIMAAIPVLIMLAAIGLLGSFSPNREEGHIVYGQFFGHWPIVGVFTSFFVLSIIVFLMGIRSYWGALKSHASDEGIAMNGSGLSKLGPVLGEIFTHKRFGKCDETEDRKTAHMFIFYAFILLFVATALSTLLTDGPLLWGGHGVESPYGIANPVKWFGIAGAAAGLIGIGLITFNRFKHQVKVGIGSYFDWLLISVIIVLMVTGVLAYVFRVADVGALAYPDYFVHLSTVLFLFVYAPFSKMAHMVYRTTALAFARTTGRDLGVED